MILSFSKKIDGKDTFFAEKILKMYSETHVNAETQVKAKDVIRFWELSEDSKNDRSPYKNYCSHTAKLHTIRTDEKNRWKQGKLIHAAYFVRTKQQYQFSPTFMCRSVQKIEIKWDWFDRVTIIVDRRHLSYEEIEQLAINDGFECLTDFVNYFNKDFTGKIIHFTDLKY